MSVAGTVRADTGRADKAARVNRRAATRAFRPRRVWPASVVAVLIAAITIAIAVLVVSQLAGRSITPPGYQALIDRLLSTRWDDLAARIAAAVIGVLGLILLWLALRPGRPRAIPLAGTEPDVVLVVTRGGLGRALGAAAADVDAVDKTRVKVRGGHVKVTVTTPLRDPGQLAEHVRAAVAARLDELQPARPPRLVVRVRRAPE